MNLNAELQSFFENNKFNSKGTLSVALVVSEHARKIGLPLDSKELLTENKGQVLGLGVTAVQNILKRNGITKILAREGGRTSRGSIGAMEKYVDFLNNLYQQNLIDFDNIEAFWINKVNLHFAGKPLRVKLDTSQSLSTLVSDLILQGQIKQKESSGHNYLGTIIQHLVGAKLDCALGVGKIKHNSSSTSDAQTKRSGDFLIDNSAIHVTTAPSAFLVSRCEENLAAGLRPIIITTKRGIFAADVFVDAAGLSKRIDVFEITQFIALNLYEFARFEEINRESAISDLIKRYNEIIEENETDPSLLIEIQK